MTWRRRLGLAFLAVAGMLNGGCALYSGARDKQGEELKVAWSKVDLTAQVTTPRKNFASILEQQLKFEDEIWGFYRTRLAEQMLSDWKVGRVENYIGEAMAAIAGDRSSAIAVMGSASAARGVRDDIEAGPKRNMAIAGISWPGCDGVDGPKGDKLLADLKKSGADESRIVIVSDSLEVGKAKCADLAQKVAAGFPKEGELAKAQKALEQDQTREADDKKALDEAKAEFDQAAKNYDTAEQTFAGDSKSGREDFDKADKRLREAADKLSKLQSSLGQVLVSEDRLKSLDTFLTTYEDVVAGKGAPEGSNRAAIALALFPDLRDKARVALRDVEKPNLVPLLQQKKVEQAKLAAAQRNLQRRQQLLELRQAHVDQLMERLSTLNTARIAVEALKPLAEVPLGPALVPLKTAPLDLPPGGEQTKALAELKVKRELWRIAALVLHAEGNLRANVGKTRYQITALAYEESVSYAESGLMQWKALLDPSVDLLAEFGASGLKAKDIQDFLNTLSLLWIAAEVNK